MHLQGPKRGSREARSWGSMQDNMVNDFLKVLTKSGQGIGPGHGGLSSREVLQQVSPFHVIGEI